MRTKLFHTASAVSLAITLSACGGGGGVPVSAPPIGGGSPAPSPTPTPAPVNETIVEPVVSGSFHTVGNNTLVTNENGLPTAASGGVSEGIEFAYDSESGSYILTIEGRTASFVRDYRQPYYSNENTSSGNIEQLRLVEEDESAARYVRAGRYLAWQEDAGNSITHSRESDFVFGFPSASEAIPSSGKAGFRVQGFGAQSNDIQGRYVGPLPTSVRGVLIVDFSNRTFSLETLSTAADVDGAIIAAASLRGNGSLALGENEFSGVIETTPPAYSPSDTRREYHALVKGMFYGPSAEEVGASMYGADGERFYSASITGDAIEGIAKDDTLYGIKRSVEYNTAYATIEGVAYYGGIYFDSEKNSIAFHRGDYYLDESIRMPSLDSEDYIAYRRVRSFSDWQRADETYVFDGSADGVELTYSTFLRRETDDFDLNGELTERVVRFASFGNGTPVQQLPVAGTGSYSGMLRGVLLDDQGGEMTLKGSSTLTVDFGDRTFAANILPQALRADGSQLPLSQYGFYGSLNYVDLGRLEGGGDRGVMRGWLYGDSAQEYGFSFSVKDSDFGDLAGVAFGVKD